MPSEPVKTNSPDWALTSAGGKVASGSGEFVFTGSDGITVLNHEIQAYDPSTGELAVWVVVPTLKATSNTELYVYYGGASAGPTNQNTPAGNKGRFSDVFK